MATLPQFKQRTLARRRSSDIDLLAQQYKKQVDQMTGQYQEAFNQYESKVSEQMKPFEEQMAQYKNVDMPSYETARATYQEQLDAYNKQLQELAANPTVPKVGYYQEKKPRWGLWGLAGYTTETKSFTYDEPKPVPTFSEKMPEAPATPQAPQIDQFDTSQFEQQRGQLESTYKREVGERKAGRMAAVSRRVARPLLQG